MSVKEILTILRSGWRLILGLAFSVVLLAAGATLLTPNTYRAQSQMFVSVHGGESVSDLASGSTFAQSQVQSYVDVVRSPIVLKPVIDQLNLEGETPTSLARKLTVAVPEQTVLMNVSVADSSPTRAAAIANAVTQQFIKTVDTLGAESASTAAGKSGPVKVTVIGAAAPSRTPVSPQPVRNILLALLVGLLIGVLGAALRRVLDTRIHNEEGARRVTDEPIVGVIPMDDDAPRKPLITQGDQQFGMRAEAFRALRTNLQFVEAELPKRSIVVSSSRPGEGKTTTSANLAVALAQSGSTVCLIEGDLRRPRLLDYMGLEGGVGLTDVLIGRARLDDVLQPYALPGLQVLGSGPLPPNPSELLGSTPMRSLMDELESRFDFVVIDAPPLLPVTDAAVLSGVAGGTLVVAGVGHVRRDELARALEILEGVDARTLGVVINREPVRGATASGYYGETYAPTNADTLNWDAVTAPVGAQPQGDLRQRAHTGARPSRLWPRAKEE